MVEFKFNAKDLKDGDVVVLKDDDFQPKKVQALKDALVAAGASSKIVIVAISSGADFSLLTEDEKRQLIEALGGKV